MPSEQEKEELAHAIVAALAYKENGGKPNLANPTGGPTGEMKSIFQFLPDTWREYATDILKDANAPLNNENELKVVLGKVKGWVNEGKTVGEIASKWNSGSFEKYRQNWKGVNKKYNVAYDTPQYAEDVINYAKKFHGEIQQAKATKQLGANIPNPPLNQSANSTPNVPANTPQMQPRPPMQPVNLPKPII